jgi:hypothetical protein
VHRDVIACSGTTLVRRLLPGDAAAAAPAAAAWPVKRGGVLHRGPGAGAHHESEDRSSSGQNWSFLILSGGRSESALKISIDNKFKPNVHHVKANTRHFDLAFAFLNLAGIVSYVFSI